MKLLAGLAISAGLLLTAGSASAQLPVPGEAGRSLYRTVSDFEAPYGGMPPAPPPYEAPYAPPAYGYEPALMPPHEVYAVLRENGFLPLGMPRRLGLAYEIAAIDPDGEDGMLLIDGRTGRIVRFTPAYWRGRIDDSGLGAPYGAQAALPSPIVVRGVPRPPGLIPHVTSRAVPLPAPKPVIGAAPPKPAEPAQPSAVEKSTAAATQPRTAAVTRPPTTGTVGEVKVPEPQIRLTEPMPPVQGLE